VERPYIRIEDTGEIVPLRADVTTVGRGSSVDIRLRDPSVSKLHAEIVCRGSYFYVADLGLSRNGTRVNGRPAARRVLEDGDVLSFGSARCRVGALVHESITAEVELRRQAAPELTRRETDVLTSLCRPALSDEAFVAPATAREIAADLVVTEAAVKQHLLRLYQKFRIAEGTNRRTRLANEVVALGLVRPLPPPGRADPAVSTPSAAGVPQQPGPSSPAGSPSPAGPPPPGAPAPGAPAPGAPAPGGPGPRAPGPRAPGPRAPGPGTRAPRAPGPGEPGPGEPGPATHGRGTQDPGTRGPGTQDRDTQGPRAAPRAGGPPPGSAASTRANMVAEGNAVRSNGTVPENNANRRSLAAPQRSALPRERAGPDGQPDRQAG
jgi:hypothetical protein